MKSDLNGIFAELRDEYINNFHDKISTIEEYWQKSDRENLEMEFHKIKGTGTTYGVREATLVAEILEDLCRNNHDKLGHALLLALDLFEKIIRHYKGQTPWTLEDDSSYLSLQQHWETLKAA